MKRLTNQDFLIVACRYVSDELMTDVQAMVKASSGELLPDLVVYPGSIERPCERCKHDVWVGPRQQMMLEANPHAVVLCMLCTVVVTGTLEDSDSVQLIQLGNPHKRATPQQNVPDIFRRARDV